LGLAYYGFTAYLVSVAKKEEAREMEGVESESNSKSVKQKCKYCTCKNYDVRVCEVKSNPSKLEEELVPKVGSEAQLPK